MCCIFIIKKKFFPRLEVLFIPSDVDISVASGDTSRYRVVGRGRLEIDDLEVGDAGLYHCILDNEHGDVTETINLTVTGLYRWLARTLFTLYPFLCYHIDP